MSSQAKVLREPNTFNLPQGTAIRRALRDVFADQRAQILAFLRAWPDPPQQKAQIGGPPEVLPFEFPEFTLGALPMSERMTPLLSVLWRRSGRRLYAQAGLDPNAWSVVGPHTADKIRTAALAFSAATNATTSRSLADALALTRDELHAGIVARGESIPLLTRRVQTVFDRADRKRAKRIAQTEAARAVHAGQDEAGIQSGVVAGWEWVASGDACPICNTIARRAKYVRIGTPFAVIGHHPDYAEVRFPPAHVHCNCTCIPVLKRSATGQKLPKFSKTLVQPVPQAADYPGGLLPARRSTARQQPETAAGITAAKLAVAAGKWVAVSAATTAAGLAVSATVAPLLPSLTESILPALLPGVMITGPKGPRSWPRMDPVLPGQPIKERIAAYIASDQGRGRLAALRSIPRDYWALRYDWAVSEEAAKVLRAQVPKGAHRTDPAAELAERARAAADAAGAKLEAHMATVRKAAADALAVKAADVCPLDAKRPAGKSFAPLKAAAVAAEGFLDSVLAANPLHPKGLKLRYGLAKGQGARSWYYQGKKRLMLAAPTAGFGPRDVVHESGHLLEDVWPEVGQRSVEFLEYRTAGETPQKMADLFPGRDYSPGELGRKDRFDEAFPVEEAWYVGKEYKVAGVHTDHYPTEVLSKGIEMLLRDPAGFAAKDPEYCGFVVGMLDGGLREGPTAASVAAAARGPNVEERFWAWANRPR